MHMPNQKKCKNCAKQILQYELFLSTANKNWSNITAKPLVLL